MMHELKTSRSNLIERIIGKIVLFSLPMLCLLSITFPAFAHHPMGGKTPANFFQGFLSGLAHPVIGLDHLAFVIAIGLLAVTKKQGITIPIAFILAAMAGTGIHITGTNLPAVEFFVSGSILLFGILLASRNSLPSLAIAALAALAGLFHGYAYGEAIFGAETTPLLSYLAGFTIVQSVISLAAFWIGKTVIVDRESQLQSLSKLRSAGLVICGIGLTFFVSQIIDTIFPVVSG
jgi:urease accessory protein